MTTETAARYELRDAAEARFLARVYRWMTLALGVSAVTAWYVGSSPELMRGILAHPWAFFAALVAEVVVVVAFTSVSRRASFPAAAAMFLFYALLSGVTLSVVVWRFTPSSLGATFAITAGMFATMSLYGTVTGKDLSGWGSFLMMGLVGIILAGVVNMFIHSSALDFMLGCAGVVTFTGLTAYHAQALRRGADPSDGGAALRGALILYLNFVNLFLSLLRLTGRQRN